jgi:CheY-like chemotaxis protein
MRERPDLILLDMLLPDADGLEVYCAIRRDPQFRTLPVVFLTTRATETDRRACLRAGVKDFLAKPFSIRELISRIGRQVSTPAPAVP